MYNYMCVDFKVGQYYQCGVVFFFVFVLGEVSVFVVVVVGEVKVWVDNVCVFVDIMVLFVVGMVYLNDFEGNVVGWGLFVKGDVNGIDDLCMSIFC